MCRQGSASRAVVSALARPDSSTNISTAACITPSRLAKLQRSLINIATNIRADSDTDLLDLCPEAAFRNTIKLIRRHYPRLSTVLGVVGPFGVLAWVIYSKIWNLLKVFTLPRKLRAYLESSISIPYSHPMREIVLSWLVGNIKTPALRSMSLQQARQPHEWSSKSSLKYASDTETTSFCFNGRTFHVDKGAPMARNEGGKIAGTDQPMTISYMSFGTRNIEPIKEFLHVVHSSIATTEEGTLFYRADACEMYWSQSAAKVARSMDSIAMEADVKERLLKDITSYLSEESKKWYASVGIPHRRGYLFFGPPGCGKSSVASALAGTFKLPVYIVTLSKPTLTDNVLEQLFSQLPARSLVLLEDVDSAGIERMTPTSKRSSKKADRSGARGVSLAGLLNVIDGACASEHRVLCMTSNTPDSLDPALVRPGRTDMKILFGNAKSEVMQQIFASIFADLPSRSMFGASHDILKLAQTFAANIPEDKITPAELQNYLLLHRDSPIEAVEMAKAWADDLIQTKAEGRNVSAFADQIGDVRSRRPGDRWTQ